MGTYQRDGGAQGRNQQTTKTKTPPQHPQHHQGRMQSHKTTKVGPISDSAYSR